MVAISISLFDCSQTLAQAERRGRAVNSGISGGHLHTCECLNRSALDTGGAQRTIQLCKHAATSFPGLLQACTETSHCLNSTHSIPVPGPHPAAASSLQARLPEQRQIQALPSARVIHAEQRAFTDMQNCTRVLETFSLTGLLKVHTELPRKKKRKKY